MEKVKLPKKVAEAIEAMRAEKFTNGAIIREMLTENAAWNESKTMLDFAYESDENFDLFAQALVNGYEVELTPEDKVKEYYFNQIYNTGSPEHNIPCAIREVLHLLNIDIEGVNT